MNQAELDLIKETLIAQVDEELSGSISPEEYRLKFQPIVDLFKSIYPYGGETSLLNAFHMQYLALEDEFNSCSLACNSVVIKAFIMGYKCRKDMTENAKLFELASFADTK